MAQAREEILLETFIIYDDKVGQPLRHALIDAARRGVRVEVAVDGYGTADLPDDFISSMTEAGCVSIPSIRNHGWWACAPTCFAACTARSW